MMTEATEKRRERSGSRRGSYACALVINGVVLYAVNIWPGWQALPFLTEDTGRVLALVNLSLIAGVLTNAVYLIVDRPRVKALGDILVLCIGLAILIAVWQVFPFAFPAGFDWSLIVRILIVLSMIGSIVGIIVQLVFLITGKSVPRR